MTNSTFIPRFCFMYIIFLIAGSCISDHKPTIVWKQYIDKLGTYSSPRCADLNKDGIKDIVLGAGLNEFEASEAAVLALDGATGELLWTVPGTDQIVGSAVFLHINSDDIPDVVIGGRSAQLMAIDGANGSVLWKFEIMGHDHNAVGYMRFNFFSPQIISDQDHDGIKDLLVANGGNIRAYSSTGEGRYPGVLGILSGQDGSLIAIDTVPDGKETYMSPIVIDHDGDGGLSVIYGTGGEIIGGQLYICPLESLMHSDLSSSQPLLSRKGHGFIAPPTLTDLNQDEVLDIIVNWHGGEMIAIDGLTFQPLWSFSLGDTELNTSPTPGDVTRDGIPDFFSSFSQGSWPKNTNAIQVIVDGSTGKALYQDTLGCTGFATALSYDFDADGSAEFLWNTNEYNCTGIYLANNTYNLKVYNHDKRDTWSWVNGLKAKNISSTPWLGDLDGDGVLDLIFCVQSNFGDIYSFYGIQVVRMEISYPLNDAPSWTEYMGKDAKGVF